MAKNKNVEIIKKGKEVPIKFNIPSTIITRFASNMVIQTFENEFKISFFEIKPEIRLDPSDEIPDNVLADCVASVIVNANKLPSFIEILQKQVDRHNKGKIKTEK